MRGLALVALVLVSGCAVPEQANESWSLTIAADGAWEVAFPMVLHGGPSLADWANAWRMSLGNGTITQDGERLLAKGTGITVFEAHLASTDTFRTAWWSDGQAWATGHDARVNITSTAALDSFSLFHEAVSADCFLEERYQVQGGPGLLVAKGTSTLC